MPLISLASARMNGRSRKLDDQVEDARAVAVLDPPRPSAGESIDRGHELALVVRLALRRRRTALCERRLEILEAELAHAASRSER